MKRKSLVIIEMLLSIIISVGIFFLIFNVYFIFKGFGKDILYINDKNREYIKNIIENPDYIVEDNRHMDTMIYLKQVKEIEKNGRVVIKLA